MGPTYRDRVSSLSTDTGIFLHPVPDNLFNSTHRSSCPDTSRNHNIQAQSFSQFCDHDHLHFLDPDISTVCLYITHLICRFPSACSIRNYVSGVRTLHKEMGLTPAALESFQVSCLFREADISMQTPPLQRLPILPHCSIASAPSLPAWQPSVLPCMCALH